MTAIANLPDIRPSLLLDFANSGRVDPRIECTRASSATCWGPDGKLRTVPANTPRIDYDPATGKCLGLLVEEARTNLFTYSNAANAGWIATRSTLTPTGEVFGGLPVMRYTATDALSGYPYRPSFSSLFQVGKTYCLSAIIRKGTAPRCNVQFPTQNGFDSNHVLTINTATLATIVATPANLVYGVRDLGSGLFLVWVSATCTKAPETPNYIPLSFPATAIGDYADICGLQLEEGSSPTSYIPTEGAAVTRSADCVEMTGANFRNWFKQEEGTFVVSGDVGRPEGRLISVSEGYVVTNQLWLRLNARSHPVTVYTGGAYKTNFSLKSGFPTISEGTIGLAYRSDGAIMSVSGEPPQYSGGAVELSGTLDTMIIGAVFNRSNPINGHVRRIAYYSRKLDGVQLQRLTA